MSETQQDAILADEKTADEVAADENRQEEAAKKEAQVGRSAAMMSALIFISRITGFFRTWGQAYAMGVTILASCYSVANNLPNTLYELVIGGMLVTAFLPVYMSVKKKLGTEGASKYVSNLVSIVIILMGAVTVLGIIFAYQVVFTQSFGATEEFDSALTVYFFRFFAIEVVLYALSSIVSGVLNAERDYFWSSAAPIFNNVIVTASFLAYAFLSGSAPKLALLMLAIGNPLGVFVQVVMQLPSMRRHGIKFRPYLNLRDPAIKETLTIGVPSLLVVVMSFVSTSVMSSSELSVMPQAASVSYYSRLWYTLPYALVCAPITTAMFTELSDSVAHGDMDGYKRGVVSGTSRILFILIPFAMYLAVFSVPLIVLLAAGKFSAADIQLTAGYLDARALVLPFYCVCLYLQKACSSVRRMGVYAAANVIGTVAQVVVLLFLTPRFGLYLVPISSGIFYLIVDVFTFWYLRRTYGSFGYREMFVSTARGIAFGLVGSVVGFIVLRICNYVAPMGSSVMRAIIYTVVGGIPAMIATFGAAILLKVPEVGVLQTVIARFRRK